MNNIRALCFDVFGTVVDWRSSIILEGASINREKGISIDWAAFADEWRARYQPSMQAVRCGQRQWTNLDVLHRESLNALIAKYGLNNWTEDEIDHLNRVWHRLRPWPDAVEGLYRLKKKFIIATISNGNIALLVNMAKYSDLPWDMVLGAEVVRHYKPLPAAYLDSVELLGLRPTQCCMVAAHNSDLVNASNHGMQTAFVGRPTEYGPNQTEDLEAEGDYNFVARNFGELADQLAC